MGNIHQHYENNFVVVEEWLGTELESWWIPDAWVSEFEELRTAFLCSSVTEWPWR